MIQKSCPIGFFGPQKEKAPEKPRLKVWEETWSERSYQVGSFRRKIILVYWMPIGKQILALPGENS